MTAMSVRQQAAQACVDRFAGKPFAWGSADCGKLVNHNLHKLGIKVGLLKGATYKSEFGAIRHLKKHGLSSMLEAMDATECSRIGAASALVGDVIALPGEGTVWDAALVVSLGNGRALGFQDGVCHVLQPDLTHAITAWRCDPCRK